MKDDLREFEQSLTMQRLDKALDYAFNDEPEKAMSECELAMSEMPRIAIAYNYLGMVLQTINQLELAIDSYLNAIQIDPLLYPARENLANARLVWQEEQYFQIMKMNLLEENEENQASLDFVEPLDSEDGEDEIEIPGWIYLDARSYALNGWAGHRHRPERSGYDPLENQFEFAHIQGVIVRRLISRTFRTRNPLYLLLMVCVGVLYSLYGVAPFTLGGLPGIFLGVFSFLFLIIGITLLINVYLSLQLQKTVEIEDHGHTFF